MIHPVVSITGERSRSGERYRRDDRDYRRRSRSRSGGRRKRTPSPPPLSAAEREALKAEEAIEDLTKDQRTVFVSQLVSARDSFVFFPPLCMRSRGGELGTNRTQFKW